MTLVLEMLENDSGYQAQFEGLEPVKANLVSSSFVGIDGQQFQSASREARNIIIKLDLHPDFVTDTFTTLRNKLYTYLMPKSEINMRFHLVSGLYVDISGIVEEHSSPMFEQDPEVEVSVMCFKPDFIDPQMITLSGGTVSDGTITPVNYPGNIEVGIVLTLNVNRTLPAFSMYNTGEDGVLTQMDFSGSLIAGDQLIVSSVRRAKGITLIRAGISSSYLFGRTAQSGWIEFSEGINQFRIYAVGDPVPYEVEYFVRYGGL